MHTIRGLSVSAVALALALASPFGDAQMLAPAPFATPEQMAYFHSVPAVVPKALSPLTVNRFARAASASFYNTVYAVTELQTDWSGSLTTPCNPGSTSATYRDATLDRLNYFRAMAGLPGNVVFDVTWNSAGQQAATMMAANNALSHSPPNTWTCYTALGATAAGESNIALGSGASLGSGPSAIKLYMDDIGTGNEALGHRRWVLYPPQANMGTGSAGLAAGNNANALHTFGAGVFGSRPATPNGVAWPPAGYVPYQVLPWDPYFGTLGRWSYSYPGADFSAATVTVTSAGASVPSTVLPVSANSYGDNTVAWSVNVPPTAPAFDKRYNVTVAGIAGAPFSSISYQVVVFDPARALQVRLDANGDGKGDILFRNAAGTNYLWNVNGAVITGGLLQIASQGQLPSVDSTWTIAGIGDFNGDGKSDILWRNASGANYVWHLDGASLSGGVFNIVSQGLLPSADATWTVAGIGDFNGDGKSDILWRKSDGTNYVWHVNGAVISGGTLQVASQGLLPSVDTTWSVAGIGDFNGDGKSDVLWRKADGTNYVWHVNGAVISGGVLQIVSQGLLPGVDATWSVAAIGDFNGDGKSDVFWRRSDGTNYVWHVNGSVISAGVLQIASQGLLPTVDTTWSVAGSADYNGDGMSDVFWRKSDGTNYVWHVNGAVISGGVLSIASQGLLPGVDGTWSVPNPK